MIEKLLRHLRSSDHLLRERLRTRVEREGRVVLGDADVVDIQVIRRTYAPLVATGVVLGVIVAAAYGSSYLPFLVNFATCWVSGPLLAIWTPRKSLFWGPKKYPLS